MVHVRRRQRPLEAVFIAVYLLSGGLFLTIIYKNFRIKTGAEPSEHSCFGMILIIYKGSCRARLLSQGLSPYGIKKYNIFHS